MSLLPLTLASSHYDHITDLANGRVPVEGVALTFLNLADRGDFLPAVQLSGLRRVRSLDGQILLAGVAGQFADRGDPGVSVARAAALVVLHPPGRPGEDAGRSQGQAHRHSGMGADRGGLFARPDCSISSASISTSIQWIQAGVDQPGRLEKVKLNLPKGLNYSSAPDKSLSGMLVSGEIDCRAVGASAVLLRARPSQHRAAVSGLSRRRDEIRQGDRHLSDHAHDRAQARDRRAQSMGGGEPVQGVRRGAAAERRARAGQHAARRCRCRGATSSPSACRRSSART